MALTQQMITDTALRILSQFGMGDLSMRRLARELDVQPSALYWHVENKQELFVLLAEQMLTAAAAEAEGTSPADLAWALRTVMLRYRDGAEICALGFAAEGARLIPQPLRTVGARSGGAGGDAGGDAGGESAAGEGRAELLMDFIFGAVLIEQHREVLGRPDPAAGARFREGVARLL